MKLILFNSHNLSANKKPQPSRLTQAGALIGTVPPNFAACCTCFSRNGAGPAELLDPVIRCSRPVRFASTTGFLSAEPGCY